MVRFSLAASTAAGGSSRPAIIAFPEPSGRTSTRRVFAASSRRPAAAAALTVMTARAIRSRIMPQVISPAPGSPNRIASAALASAGVSRLHATAMIRAFARSITPSRSAAEARGSLAASACASQRTSPGRPPVEPQLDGQPGGRVLGAGLRHPAGQRQPAARLGAAAGELRGRRQQLPRGPALQPLPGPGQAHQLVVVHPAERPARAAGLARPPAQQRARRPGADRGALRERRRRAAAGPMTRPAPGRCA